MNTNKMETMKMKTLVFNMSLPLMISLLIQSLYNIVDSLFVSRISSTALTATSLVYPVQLLLIALGVGTSVGVNALLSKSIGEKNEKKVKTIATTAILIVLIEAMIFLIVGLFFTSSIVSSLTHKQELIEQCYHYLSICLIFSGGSLIATMYQRFLQSVGDTFYSMLSLLAGAITNIILDPLLIFGIGIFPKMGITGAAIATVTGQWVSTLLAIYLNKTKNPTVSLDFEHFTFSKSIVLGIYKVGLPTIITQALGSVMMACMNQILMPYSMLAVAFFGIYYKLQSFLFMPMNGLGQAAIPIVGFNYGANNKERIKELMKTILPVGIILSLMMTIIFELFPAQLLMMFQANDILLNIGVIAMRIIALSFVLTTVSLLLGYIVSGLGVGMINMIATLLRQFVILIPLAKYTLNLFGIEGVWISILIAEIIACIYACVHSTYILKKRGIKYERT